MRKGAAAVAAVLGITVAWSAAALASTPNPLREFFPYGVYVGGGNPVQAGPFADLAEEIDWVGADLAAHHFNCAWLNNLDYQLLPLWLEAGERHGVRIIPQGGGPPAYLIWSQGGARMVAEQMVPFWYETARQYRDSRSLLAYSVVEEIPPEPELYEAIASLTRLTAAVDPLHPMIVLYNKAASAEMACRMVRPQAIAWDGYPFFRDPLNGPHTPAGSLSYFSRMVHRFYQAARSIEAPLWVMGQGMDITMRREGQPVENAGYRRPTPAEMRWQVWCALCNGAKGIFFFYYSGTPPPENGEYIDGLIEPDGTATGIYEEAARVSQEIDPLKPLFLRLDEAAPDEDVVYWIESPHIRARTFKHQDTGARYLVVFNADATAAHPTQIELARFPRAITETTGLYDVRRREVCATAWPDTDLKERVIEPGDGAVFLVFDDDETLQEHRRLYEG